MTAVHNSNPDVGRECIAVNLLNKLLTCLVLSVAQKGLGTLGEREFGLRNSEISLSPDNTPLGEWRNINSKPRLRTAIPRTRSV